MYIGVNNDRLVSINEVATAFDISRNHLMKIVHELGKEGYLETVRGKNGGFRLAKPAHKINIGQVIRFTEDDLIIVECFDREKANCKILGHCKLTGVLREALDSFFSVLDNQTLEDLIENDDFADCLRHNVI